MTLYDFITLQEQYTKHEVCQNMAETLVATTKERLYRQNIIGQFRIWNILTKINFF